MAPTTQVAASQKAWGYSESAAVYLSGLVVDLALYCKPATEAENSSQKDAQLVSASLGISAMATAYTIAATVTNDSTDRREKVRVGQHA